MRVVCAPDSFKGSLSAAEAAAAIEAGVLEADPSAGVDRCPVSDGGEGFVQTLHAAAGGRLEQTRVLGPLGEPVLAQWAVLADETAVIEMAAASGLDLVPPPRRDPTRTTSYGLGQLIGHALDHGSRHILVGIGGSATNDGGTAMAQALGVTFHDNADEPITRPLTGGDLASITRIDLKDRHPGLAQSQTRITVACDVTNPLTGMNGAAAVYGPQKGATADQVARLDAGLVHLAQIIRRDLGVDVEDLPGAGAAGGMGGGLVALAQASLQGGGQTVLDAVRFDHRIAHADLCLTGEGRLDGQTLSGKTILAVAQAAGQFGVPTVALVGSLGPGAQRTLDAGLSAYHLIGDDLSQAQSIRQCASLLRAKAREVVTSWACR